MAESWTWRRPHLLRVRSICTQHGSPKSSALRFPEATMAFTVVSFTSKTCARNACAEALMTIDARSRRVLHRSDAVAWVELTRVCEWAPVRGV